MTQSEFIKQVLEMAEWSSLVCDSLRLTVHRFPDGWWWAMWHNPRTARDLGRILHFENEVRQWLGGNPHSGKLLNLETAQCL